LKEWLQRPRVWVVLLLAVLLLVFGGTSFVRRVTAVEPLVGVDWLRSSSGPVAIEVMAGSPADRAGVEVGDVLLAIDGRSVLHVLDADELGWKSGAGESVRLRVRRAGADRVLVIEPEWTPRTEPYIYLVIVGLAFFLSGSFIALRWPGIRGGIIYACFAGCVFVHLTASPVGRADALDWSFGWGSDVAGSLWPALLLHLGVALTRRTMPWRRSALVCAYGTSLGLIGMSLWISPALLGGAYRWRDPAAAIEAWVDRPVYLWISAAVLLTIGILARSYARSPSAMHRSQMRWMLWGLALGFGPFVTLYAVPWAMGAAELPEWARFLAVMPMPLMPATFTAALARYRLYDFDVLMLRVVTEVTAVIFTFAVLAATVFLLRKGIGGFIPLSRGVSRYLGLLTAAIAYPQLRHWVTRGAERAFYKQRYSYRATLLDWARELNAETDLVSLLRLLRTRIRDTLGVPEAVVLIRADAERFEALGESAPAAPVDLDPEMVARLEQQASVALDEGGVPGLAWARYLFSMKVKDRLRAVLAIAEREHAQEPLTTEDRALLSTLAAHAATAIEAARLVREVSQRADEVGRLHALQAKILESSAVGLLLLDAAGRVLAWNRALEEIYGLPRTEAIGRRLGEVFPLHVARRIGREGGTDESRIFRLNMADRAGRRLIVNIAISRADAAGAGGEGGLVVTFDDVTQRVELEEQVLQRERLASLGLLAAGVAHEINTPLTGISSYTQLLLEGEDEDTSRDVLEKIEAQTRRASGITRSLLNLARPEETVFEALDLNEAVREVLQLFEPQVRRGAVRLRSRLDEELPPVRGNKGKLQQVLLNLLLNARDAVGESGEIVVSTSPGRGAARLEVADDGVGISEEDLPRIFDPFFSTKGRGKGTGLGLSITFGIVREHGGRIRAESQPGGLTRFHVELPAADRAKAMA
jgi:PAS domain S-box-containing protein